MKLFVTSVFDTKGGFYSKPFYSRSKGEAIREFIKVVNHSDSPFKGYEEDYVLFELGLFDDVSGSFDLLSASVSLGKACEFLSKVADVA